MSLQQQLSKYPPVVGSHGFVITPSDTVKLPKATNKLYVGAAGDVTVIFNEDQAVTAPTTFDPASIGSPEATLSNGNLQVNSANVGYGGTGRTLDAVSSGKFYAEFKLVQVSVNAGGAPALGVGIIDGSFTMINQLIGKTLTGESVGIYNNTTDTGLVISHGNGTVDFTDSHVLVANDIIGIALDLGGNTLQFFVNGVSKGIVNLSTIGYAGSSFYMAAFCGTENAPDSKVLANFGATAYVETPPAGFGNFTHTTPATPVLLKAMPIGMYDLAIQQVMQTGTASTSLVGIY